MLLRGSSFGVELPEAWSEVDSAQGMAVAVGDHSDVGLTPTLVLRESRLSDPAPDALAALSQANIEAAAKEVPGYQLVHIEAIPDPDSPVGERRRSWAFLPVELDDGLVMTVTALQELCLAGDCVAEVTVTLPPVEPDALTTVFDCLDSLSLLPVETRRQPATVSDPGAVRLDEWVTARDGKPRELLPLPPSPMDIPLTDAVVIDEDSFAHLQGYAKRGEFLRRLKKMKGAALEEAGVIDSNADLTEFGERLVKFIQSGDAWTCDMVAAQRHAKFYAYGRGTTSLIAYSAESAGKYHLGFCPTNEISRCLLRWTGTTAAWPMTFDRSVSGHDFEELLGNQSESPGDEGDFAEFCRQPWAYAAVEDDLTHEGFSWVTTPTRGGAFLEFEAHRGKVERATLVRSPEAPVWQLISLSALSLSLGHGMSGAIYE